MAGNTFSDTFKYDPDYHRVADFLGLDRDSRNDIKMAKKISTLYDWAMWDTGKDDMESLMSHIDKLTKSEGISFRGQPLIDHLYQKVRIHMDKLRQAKTEMDKRIKRVEAQEKLKEAVKEGKEYRKRQEQIKQDTANQNKVSQRELDKYIKRVEKTRPDYENKMKAKDVPMQESKAEYV